GAHGAHARGSVPDDHDGRHLMDADTAGHVSVRQSVYTGILPFQAIREMVDLDPDFQRFKIDLANGAVLEKGRVYVVPLAEFISLKSEVAAFANPKSSTGRLDILTRLIADGATHFDQVEDGYKGQLYIEIAPRSFSVVVKTGTRLNQLRFRRTRGLVPKQITASEWSELLENGLIVGEGARDE